MNLYHKIKAIELEVILFFFFKTPLTVNLFNINRVLNYHKVNSIFKYSRLFLSGGLFYFKDLTRCVFFGLHLKNSALISYIVSRHITNKKNHFYYMRNVSRIIRYLLHYELKPEFLGFRIKVHGKFRGILRKRFFKMKKGRVGLQRLSTKVTYSLHRVFTRYGVFSVKV